MDMTRLRFLHHIAFWYLVSSIDATRWSRLSACCVAMPNPVALLSRSSISMTGLGGKGRNDATIQAGTS